MYKKLVFIIVYFSLINSNTTFAKVSCFEDHVIDAINLNQSRYQFYSDYVSPNHIAPLKKMIQLEKILKPIARRIDIKSSQLEPEFQGIICNSLVPILDLPINIRERVDNKNWIKKYDINTIYITFKEKYFNIRNNKDFLEAENYLISNLRKNQKSLGYCLTRHFLESIAYTMKQSEMAIFRLPHSQNYNKVFQRFIKLHFLGVNQALQIDEDAFEVQRKGIMIICNELPPIPY